MGSPSKIPAIRLIAPLVAALLLLNTGSSQQPQGGTTVPSVPAKPSAPATSTSVNGQFVIHGTDLNTRSAFIMLCNDTASSLNKLLRDDGKFLIPIVVVLKTPPDITLGGPAISTNINQLAHGGFHLQMNVQLRPDFLSEDFARELVRILLAERILRNHKELQTTRQRVLPDWVLTGVTQALEFRSRSKPSAFFSAVFQRGQIYSVDKLLSAEPSQLDSLARGIYDTSCCALVLTLLEQPDGSLRFAKFLNSLALDNKPERDLLKDSFPTLAASKNSLEKWWSLQMATLATPAALETLSVEETESKLSEALTLRFDPLPEETKKKKAKSTTKPASPAAPELPVEDPKRKSKPLFSPPNLNLPFIGGKKISFASKPQTDTDGSSETEPEVEKKKSPKKKDAPKSEAAPPEKKPTVKSDTPPAKLKAKPHPVTDRPAVVQKPTKAEATPKENPKKPEQNEAEKKRSPFNPLNWFRGKEKPADPAKTETPKKKTEKTDKSRLPDGVLDDAKYNDQGMKIATGPFIDEFNLIIKRPDKEKILQRNLDLLAQLKLQANPLYRPLINDYADAISLIKNGKEKNAVTKLVELKKRHLQISQQAKAVESYADWYEASETKGYSGTFEDYLRLCDKIDKEIRPRTDAISKYLDALAKEYE